MISNTSEQSHASIDLGRSVTNILVLCLIAILMVWGAVMYKLASDREQAVNKAIHSVKNIANSFQEHAESSIMYADEALRLIKFHYEVSGLTQLKLVNQYFAAGAVDISFLNQVGVINEHGIYEHSNLPNHRPIDLSDREHFKVHKTVSNYHLYLSKPLVGRASGKWSIQMTRRLSNPDGSFKGVAVASLDPHYFHKHYKKIDVGTGGLIGLIGLDGYARTIRVGDEPRLDDVLQKFPLPQQVHQQDSGYYFSNEQFDYRNRLYYFQRIQQLPMVALVGMDASMVYADYYKSRWICIGAGLLVSLLIVLLAYVRYRYVKNKIQISNNHNTIKNLERENFETRHECASELTAIRKQAELGALIQNLAPQIVTATSRTQANQELLSGDMDDYEKLIDLNLRFQQGYASEIEMNEMFKTLQPQRTLENMRNHLELSLTNIDNINLLMTEIQRKLKCGI